MSKELRSDKEDSFPLNPPDQYMDSRKCIMWTHFYNYDISSERLQKALETIAEMYSIVCGRLRRDDITGMKVSVQRGKGFQFADTNSDCNLLEAISKARVADQVADFPSLARLPFFVADLNCQTFYDEESPLFSVKLVHYKDNTCSLAAAIRHYICDGNGLVNLLIDLARAYCGQPLRKVDHDRSRLWPDVFLHKVDIGLSPHDYPKQINSSLEVKSHSIPGETYSMENIYFPKKELESLKTKVMQKLKGTGSYVSLSDIVAAVQWMLQCELNVFREGKPHPVKTALDLEIAGTTFLFPKNFASEETTLLPRNYFGNGTLTAAVRYPKSEVQSHRSCNLLNTLVEASHAIRRKVLATKSSSFVANALLNLYTGKSLTDTIPSKVSGVSSLHKMPFHKIDFQRGPPVFSFIPPTYPFSPGRDTLSSLANGNGMLLSFLVSRRDQRNAINSEVLRELCPTARFVSQMTSLQFFECCIVSPVSL